MPMAGGPAGHPAWARAAVLAGLALLPGCAPKPTPVSKGVAACVDYVHNTRPTDGSKQPLFLRFDASYDGATGQTTSNAATLGDLGPLYAFNSCMERIGLPGIRSGPQ